MLDRLIVYFGLLPIGKSPKWKRLQAFLGGLLPPHYGKT